MRAAEIAGVEPRSLPLLLIMVSMPGWTSLIEGGDRSRLEVDIVIARHVP